MASPSNPISAKLVNKLLDPSVFGNGPSPILVNQSSHHASIPTLRSQFYNPAIPSQFISGGNELKVNTTLTNLTSGANVGSFGVMQGSSGLSLPTAQFPSHLHHGSLSYLEPIPTPSVLRQPKPITNLTNTPVINFTDSIHMKNNLNKQTEQHMLSSYVTRPVILSSMRQGLQMPPRTMLESTQEHTNQLVSHNHYSDTEGFLSRNGLNSQKLGTHIRSQNYLRDTENGLVPNLHGSIVGTELLNSVKRNVRISALPQVHQKIPSQLPVATGLAFFSNLSSDIRDYQIIPAPSYQSVNKPWSPLSSWSCGTLILSLTVLLILGLFFYFVFHNQSKAKKYKNKHKGFKHRNLRRIRKRVIEDQDIDHYHGLYQHQRSMY